MLLQQSAHALDRCGVDQAHFDHRVWIAHRHRREAHGLTLQWQQVFLARVGEADQRHLRRFEQRHAHRHRVLAIAEDIHGVAGQRAVDHEVIALRTALAYQPGSDAARAVAALLGIGTIGVPDAV
ncbi:hypothetical protein D3C72_758020 [compost metagenome]